MIKGVFALALALTTAPASDVIDDRLKVLGTDALTAQIVDYCRRNAPARAPAITAAWQTWRTASQVDAMRPTIDPGILARAESGFADKRAAVDQKLAASDPQCTQIAGMFTQAGMDMHTLYSKAYPIEAAPPAQPTKAPAEDPHTLPPGKGLTTAKIETIVSSFHWGYEGVQYTLFENAFLLLKDGTARYGVPSVGPRDFDVAADRAASPGLWGKWQKQGGQYLLHFEADKGFVVPDGEEVHGPASSGQVLNGDYSSASGYTFIGGAGSYTFHHLMFRGDGRFTRANSGFTGGTMGAGATTVAAGTSWDDKGSATTITGAGAAMRGGVIDRRGTPDADLQGTYRIDGYELDLSFFSGRHESHFFYITPKHDLIGVDNGTMILPH